MSTAYALNQTDRPRTWRLAIVGVSVLVLLGAGALAFVTLRDDAPAAEHEAPAATQTPAAALPPATVTATAAPPAPVVAARAPTFTVGDVSGAPGVPVDAPIRLEGADGLGSASIRLTYDPSVVALTSVRAGDVPQGALTWHHDAESGSLVLLVTTSLPAGATGDVDFAIVTLEAKDGAVGELSPLDVEVRGGVLADGTGADLASEAGSFRNGVPGDVVGDGTVDRADYEALAAYLVGDGGDIIKLNADLDGNGEVTDADAVRLHQYLDGARESP